MRLACAVLLVGCGFTSPSVGGDATPGSDERPIDAPVPDAAATPDAPGARKLILHATADAYIRQQFPDENHGLDPDLRTGSGSTISRANRLFAMFDVSAIPGDCQLTAAALRLYYYAEDFTGISPTLAAYRVTAAWNETAVTWNSRQSGTLWAAQGGDHDPTQESAIVAAAATFGWMTWDVTALTTKWRNGTAPNFGIEVAEPNDDPGNLGRKLFYSAQSSNTTDLRPYLTVDCAP